MKNTTKTNTNSAAKQTVSPNKNKVSGSKLAAVLIRGKVMFKHDLKETLLRLNLMRKNNCVIIPDNSVNRGMLNKVKDMVTWGPISDAVCSKVESRRPVKGKDVNLKSYSLSPPRGGFERKGIKKPFSIGGALGERDNMDDLLSRMV